jgi:peptidoglycan hydrolase-like protein with peptidoglycan-binding domain
MVPIIPILGLGVIMLLVLTSSKEAGAKELPGAPPGGDPLNKMQHALGGAAGIAALNHALSAPNTNAENLKAYYDRLKPYAGDPMVDATLNQLEQRMKTAPSGTTGGLIVQDQYKVPAGKDSLTYQTPGVWQGLTVDQQNKVAGYLIALGVDPQTGTIKPGAASTQAISDATLYAAELTRLGLQVAGQSLRGWAEAAAKDIPCQVPVALAVLPNELACAISRSAEMEKDPTKLRALIGKLQAYAHIPQVALAIDLLTREAERIESEQRLADEVREIDAIKKDQPVPVVQPPGMSPTLQKAMADAIARLEQQGVAAAPYANQIGNLLKANGYPTEGDRLIAMARQAETAVKPPVAIPTQAPTMVPYVKTLKWGASGAEVVAYQTGLKAAGYDPGTVDGMYGAKTFTATKALQKDAGLTIDGDAGKQTFAALNAKLGRGIAPVAPTYEPPAYSPPTYSPPAIVTAPTTLHYTVKAGDWGLSKIAKDLIGDGNRWKELVAANPDKPKHSTAGLIFHAGDRLRVPDSWVGIIQSRGITVSGDCIGGNCGCVGADCGCVGIECGCVGCGPVISGDGFDVRTHFEVRGHVLYAHGYLSGEGGPKFVSVKVDLRPIAKALMALHLKLHGGSISGVEVGRRKKFGRKLARGVKRLGKAKALRALAKGAKKVTRAVSKAGKVIKSKAARTFTRTLAVIMPPVGVPVLAAHAAARKLVKKVETGNKVVKAGRRLTKKVTGRLKKVASYAQRAMRGVRSKLAKAASKKGLLNKYGPKKVSAALNKASRAIVKRKLGRVLAKAPALRRQLQSTVAASKKLAQTSIIRQAKAVQNSSTVKKLEALRKAAQQGNQKAVQASRILSVVARNRAAQAAPTGQMGVLIDAQGRTIHGRYLPRAQGTQKATLMTEGGKQAGFYTRV